MSEQIHHLHMGRRHFVSLDGRRYLGISRAPNAGEGDEIQAMIDGRGQDTLPILVTRRALLHLAEERGTEITEQRVER